MTLALEEKAELWGDDLTLTQPPVASHYVD